MSPTAKYSFFDKSLTLGFSHPTLNWKLLGISGFYNLTSEKLKEKDFAKVYTNFMLSSREQFFQVDLNNVNRHVLMERFTFQLRYKFNDSSMVYSTDFYADVCFAILKIIFSV